MLISASRRFISSQLSIPTRAIAVPLTTYSALSNRRYSSSSSSSNSRNGGIANRAQPFKRKLRQIDNTTSPAAVPAVVPSASEVEVSHLQSPQSLENSSLPFVPTTGHLHRAGGFFPQALSFQYNEWRRSYCMIDELTCSLFHQMLPFQHSSPFIDRCPSSFQYLVNTPPLSFPPSLTTQPQFPPLRNIKDNIKYNSKPPVP